MKKVSLIVTVLNEAATIELLLEAVAAQTKLPEEFIIVDGGSSDDTMLDAIPALGPTHTGTSTLYFPHIAAQ